MAALTIQQKLGGTAAPVSQHAIAAWTTISQKAVGTTVTQQTDGTAGRTQVKAH